MKTLTFLFASAVVFSPGAVLGEGLLKRLFGRHVAHVSPDLEQALADLPDDTIKWNATDAYDWLLQHGKGHAERLLAEYQKTDYQAKTVILAVLMQDHSFKPTPGFLNWVLDAVKSEARDDGSRESILQQESVSSLLPDFLAGNLIALISCIPELIEHENLEVRAAVTRALYLKNRLKDFRHLYTQPLLDEFAFNLGDDEIEHNAMFSAYVLYLLGDHVRATLQKASSSVDVQRRYVAKFLISYLDKKITKAELADRLDGITDWDHPGNIWLNLQSLKELDMPGSDSPHY